MGSGVGGDDNVINVSAKITFQGLDSSVAPARNKLLHKESVQQDRVETEFCARLYIGVGS